jgi:glycosyltransferase involved in cell wall biosynthesis
METSHPEVTVHVIIPARNEEDCLGRCLQSLVSQQGIAFQITVVDDGSTDRTRGIAESFPTVHVVSASEPAPGIMGKCNALITGAAGSKAKWLLFTDADTFHCHGSLAAAVGEAEANKLDLLSFSPKQETVSLAEQALMPVVFSDLARTYPPERVNNPKDPAVAANGQYIMVRREVYEALGGHKHVANNLLEDVELARLFKVSNHRIKFRFGHGIVRTRMYRTFRSMWEGWTKNLTLLFRHPLLLAALRGLEFLAIIALLTVGLTMLSLHKFSYAAILLGVGSFFYLLFLLRVRRAHFPWKANLLSIFGLPLFVLLLVRSYIHSNVRGELTWKGRKYKHSVSEAAPNSSKGHDLH